MRVVQSEKRSLSALCALLGYTRQAYYKSIKTFEVEQFQIEVILQQVLYIRADQPNLGGRKLYLMIQGFLAERQIYFGRDAFFDMLREHRLLVKKRRCKKPITTFSRHWYRKYPNLIVGYSPLLPRQLWVSDITYIKVGGDFAYLSLITDAYSRKVVGHYLSEDLTAFGCLQALQMALSSNPVFDELIHHSDRGIQYCSHEYVNLLLAARVKISMTQSGDPLENAIAERLNGILKTELLHEKYANYELARFAVAQAIIVYNMKRPHSSIDMLTPEVAHLGSGELKRRWKTYYKKTERKEVSMV